MILCLKTKPRQVNISYQCNHLKWPRVDWSVVYLPSQIIFGYTSGIIQSTSSRNVGPDIIVISFQRTEDTGLHGGDNAHTSVEERKERNRILSSFFFCPMNKRLHSRTARKNRPWVYKWGVTKSRPASPMYNDIYNVRLAELSWLSLFLRHN